MHYITLCLLVLILAFLGGMGIGAHEGQIVDKVKQRDDAALKLIDEQLPIVDFDEPKPTEPVAKARRLAKDRRHNLKKQPLGDHFTIRTRVYDWPANFPPLPIEESSAIIIGGVSEAKAHITEDKSSVYSEVELKVDEVLKGNEELLSGIVAEREGGRVRFPSGVIFRHFVDGRGIPKVGHRYLLFLKQLDDGNFSIVTGYELVEGRVVPLDVTGVVPFAKYKGADETEFLLLVRDSIKNQTSRL